MEVVKCPECGKEEPYSENSMQICWDCNQHMTLKGLPDVVIKIPIRDYGSFVECNFSNVDKEESK